MSELSANYWNSRYAENTIGWDTGGPTTPFVEFFKTLKDKNTKILIPGCGHAHEGELLHKLGFTNVDLLDVSEIARSNFLKRVPSFPANRFLVGDFFELNDQFDLILEQTFFCALPPKNRTDYAKQMQNLLKVEGSLVGVLFQFPLTEKGPPFGGSLDEYQNLFSSYFTIEKLEDCYNSIPPRAGNELFIHLQKTKNASYIR